MRPFRRPNNLPAPPLLIGLLALFASTLLLCLGTSLPLLVVGRILQGVSAAIVWTVGLALLADTVEHEKIGQAMGYVAISMSVSVLMGPLWGCGLCAGGVLCCFCYGVRTHCIGYLAPHTSRGEEDCEAVGSATV